ncbi:hypothetical protein [Vibrio parahaemolyticus]|uniref:hypothetical protein n=1 Tax=Vibrio parahaemolyticus TaxID=670 RepID=UPI0005F239D0|nr:hypothetical protein [Vibrio parahaemolyticus]
MTEFHCGTRLVKGLAFKFDSANQRVCLGQSFYYDHFRCVREAVRTALGERMGECSEVVVSGFNRMLDTIMSDMRLLTFSNECSKALWSSCESREEAHSRMMYIASTLATLANKKMAEMFRAESEIIRACKPELTGKQSPMELIAIVLESMSSKARKVDEPLVSPIH